MSLAECELLHASLIMLSLISCFMTLYRLEIIIRFGVRHKVRHSPSSPMGSARESLKTVWQDLDKMKPVQTDRVLLYGFRRYTKPKLKFTEQEIGFIGL